MYIIWSIFCEWFQDFRFLIQQILILEMSSKTHLAMTLEELRPKVRRCVCRAAQAERHLRGPSVQRVSTKKKWSSLCIYLYNTCNTVTPWLYMYTTYCVNMESPYSKCTFGHVECISLKASGMTSCEMRSKCLVNATEDAISTLESSHFSMFFRMCPVCSW